MRLLAAHALLHDQLAVVLRGQRQRRPKFLAVMRLADAHRRAQVRRLHKDRILERRLDLRDGLARRLLPLGAQQRDVLDDGQLRPAAKSRFITSLSMPAAEPSTPEPT